VFKLTLSTHHICRIANRDENEFISRYPAAGADGSIKALLQEINAARVLRGELKQRVSKNGDPVERQEMVEGNKDISANSEGTDH
jgi:hypothetical protein